MDYSTNFSMRKPQGGEPVLVADINYNTDTIDTEMLRNRTMSARPYEQTESYTVGQMRIYEGILYKCVSDTSGNWDVNAWEVVNLAEEVEDVRENAGTAVEANPSDASTDVLRKLKVDGVTYETGIDYLTVQNGTVCAVFEA